MLINGGLGQLFSSNDSRPSWLVSTAGYRRRISNGVGEALIFCLVSRCVIVA